MKTWRSSKRCILALVIALAMVLSLLPVSVFAAGETVAYLGFTSDVHDKTDNLQNWLTNAKNSGIDTLNYMVFGGDYSYGGASATVVSTCSTLVSDTFPGAECVFAKGNHDSISLDAGLVYSGSDYAIYVMDSSSQSFSQSDMDDLADALDSIEASVPVFVASHCPIHWFSLRTIGNAGALIDILNEHPNVVFLWGHNHSQNDPSYGTIRMVGDSIQYTSSSADTKTINFTYANFGAIYDSVGGNNGAYGMVATLGKTSTGTSIEFQYRSLTGATGSPITIVIPGDGGDDLARYVRATSIESQRGYIVVAETSDGNFALSSQTTDVSGAQFAKAVPVSKIGQYIDAGSVTDGLVWIFTPDGDGFDLTNGDLYLNRDSGSSGGDPSRIFTDTEERGSSYSDWQYDFSTRRMWVYSSSGRTEFHVELSSSGSTRYFSASSDTGAGVDIYLYELTGPPTQLDSVAVSGIAPPVEGEAPDISADTGAGYTAGPVTWEPAVSGQYDYDTVYTASVTLTASSGYVFGDSLTALVNGNPAASVVKNPDGTATVTYVFPKTGRAPAIRYQYAAAAQDGKTYVIVARKTGGAYALSSIATGNNLQGVPVTVSESGEQIISGVTDANRPDLVWTFTTASTANRFDVTNKGRYLNRVSGSTPTLNTLAEDGQDGNTNWLYDGTNHNLDTVGSQGTYYLYHTSNYFTCSRDSQVSGTIYLYEAVEDSDTPIFNVDITGITPPVAGATQDTLADGGEGYTLSSVVWAPVTDEGKFGYNTAYTATVTVTADEGYVFESGVTATVNGEAAVIGSNSGTVMEVSYTFEPTEPVVLESISAEFTQGDLVVYPDTELDYLKQNLVVTATNSDSTTFIVAPEEYELSGTLVVGQSIVTVTYMGKSAMFTVNVTEPTAPTATLRIDPVDSSVVVGRETVVTVKLDGGENIMGVDLLLSYDPDILSVVDVREGCINDLIAKRDDSELGKVWFAATNQTPQDFDDAVVLTVTFRGLASGLSEITFTNHQLTAQVADQDIRYVPNQAVPGTITVISGGTVHGYVSLGGRQDHSGGLVTVEGTEYVTMTAETGEFTLTGIPEGEATIVITKKGYLVRKVTVMVVAGETSETYSIVLRAGDANGDNTVDLIDLTLFATAYRSEYGDPDYRDGCDFNEDMVIDLIDLTLLATNYRETGD